jgi:hypothetical protein
VARIDLGNDPFLANLAVSRLRDAGIKVSDVIGANSGEAAHFPTQGLWIFIRAEDADQVRAILVPMLGAE